MKKVKKAIFPVAGFGTRMLPATKSVPKEMLTLIDKPIIHYSAMEVLEAGIEELVFVTSRSKKPLDDYFDDSFELNLTLERSGKFDALHLLNEISKIKVTYVRQKQSLGLGHAILQAKEITRDEPFLVVLPDDVIQYDNKSVSKQLLEVFEKYQKSVIALQEVAIEETHKYGVVKSDAQPESNVYHLSDMVEKPSNNPPSNLAIVGRYVLTPDIMDELEKVEAGAIGEIQLTDAIKNSTYKNGSYGYIFEGTRYDCGNKKGFFEATLGFAKKDPDLQKILARECKNIAK